MTHPAHSVPAAPPSYTLIVDEMSCEHCQQAVETAAIAVPGVTSASVDLAAGTLTVTGGDPALVCQAVAAAGYPASPSMIAAKAETVSCSMVDKEQAAPVTPLPQAGSYELQVADMHCASCVSRVELAIAGVPGVTEASVNLLEQSAVVRGGDPEQVVRAVAEAGYGAQLALPSSAQTSGYLLRLGGLHCASCVNRVEETIQGVPGVMEANVNLIDQNAWVQGGDPEQVVQAVQAQGYEATLENKASEIGSFYLRILATPDGEALEEIIEVLEAGSGTTMVNIEGERLRVTSMQHPADLLLRLTDIGYEVAVEEVFVDPSLKQAEETRREIRRSWQRAVVAAVVGFMLMAGSMTGLFPLPEENRWFWAVAALGCLGTMVFSGRHYFVGAWKQARHFSANMDTLVAMGTGAAWLSSVLVITFPQVLAEAGQHLYLDASVMILAFLQFGHALETRAKRTTSEALSSLLGLRARTARVLRKGAEAEIPISLLQRGDMVRVRPGEKVPIDGVILEGSTTIDESMLTGEPLAVKRLVGDEVTGGTMNRSGSFILKVTRMGEETTLAKIVAMVRNAQMSKPPIGRLVDKIAAVFVPTVITIACVTFCLWLFLMPDASLAFALTTGIAVLVIACPCALGLATPIAIMVGTSRAAQSNVLIRNSEALQTASGLSHVVVDKTGTLTRGMPTVTAVFPAAGQQEEQLIIWAASLEQHSEHPLAEAVVRAAKERALSLVTMEDFSAVAGRGIQARHDGTAYLLGNHHFLTEQGLSLPAGLDHEARQQAASGGTPVWLGTDRDILGLLVLKDPLRADSKTAVEALTQRGITVVMCTGDNQETALAVAREMGITEVHSEMLPAQKLGVIQALQNKGFRVGMVGDGVNDAPALAQANTGFALASGTDVAIENADITLTGNSLGLVVAAIAVSSATIRNIKQNLFGAFLYNVIGIPLAAGVLYPFTGWLLHPMFASAAMALSSVTVVTNANRLRFLRLR